LPHLRPRIPSQRLRANWKGEGKLSPFWSGGELKYKHFYMGLQFSCFKDREGIKVSLKIRLAGRSFDRLWIFRKSPPLEPVNHDLIPKLPAPEVLAVMPDMKALEPEDIMGNVDSKPEDMSYAEWMRSKNIGIHVKPLTHTDSGLPQEVISAGLNKTQEIFDLNKSRQGKALDPDDIGE